MSAFSELIIAFLMAIGILGTVIPFVPGLALTWFAGGLWAYFDGGDSTRVKLFVLMTIFTIAGYAAQFVLPAATATAFKAPPRTILLGSLLGLIGFFIVPVIGAPMGFMAGVYASFLSSTNDSTQAWNMAVRTAVAYGWGLLLQVAFGILIALTWIVGLIIT